MINTKKKYQSINEEHYPDNGNMVHYYIRNNNLSKTQLVKDLGIAPTTLNRYFKHDSLQFGILWRLSKALNHNFPAQMSEYLQIPFETQTEKKLKVQLSEKEELIKKLEMELEIYRQMRK